MRLAGKVAVVTGASRGAGRGIAKVLGEEGATVYVTGRTSRECGSPTGRPETIEHTAEMVTARGGSGVAVRCDHTDDRQVRALFGRVGEEHGRLDILVSNAWGGYERDVDDAPVWELAPEHLDLMLAAGLRAHILSVQFAGDCCAPLGAVSSSSPPGRSTSRTTSISTTTSSRRRSTGRRSGWPRSSGPTT
ncbi:SDR family NAD(P)-dependent oxidoreductase [Actinopolymorpha sp. B11F2]|uniref:SDR family NAD(P)-dependent oxidoreductase n=1 Tax=Actinopolymorpha sp. B11F2 TaxID=3160862 RepID=UPI0032E3CAE4